MHKIGVLIAVASILVGIFVTYWLGDDYITVRSLVPQSVSKAFTSVPKQENYRSKVVNDVARRKQELDEARAPEHAMDIIMVHLQARASKNLNSSSVIEETFKTKKGVYTLRLIGDKLMITETIQRQVGVNKIIYEDNWINGIVDSVTTNGKTIQASYMTLDEVMVNQQRFVMACIEVAEHLSPNK